MVLLSPSPRMGRGVDLSSDRPWPAWSLGMQPLTLWSPSCTGCLVGLLAPVSQLPPSRHRELQKTKIGPSVTPRSQLLSSSLLTTRPKPSVGCKAPQALACPGHPASTVVPLAFPDMAFVHAVPSAWSAFPFTPSPGICCLPFRLQLKRLFLSPPPGQACLLDSEPLQNPTRCECVSN